MTQVFAPETGDVIPVTIIQAGPCHVLQLKTKDRDGYEAVQLGYLDKPRRLATRAQRGHVAKLDSKRQRSRTTAGISPVAKAACEPKRFVREFRMPVEGFEVGQEIKVDVFNGIKAVDVVAITKGRGYTGVMVRHNFSGQRATHGVKKVHRHGGSTGMNTEPAHVFKGKRMSGQHGNERVTTRNIKVARVDAENNLLLINGSVPGPNGGYVVIRVTNKLPVPKTK
jgi:large subunit ribosomal protein L3